MGGETVDCTVYSGVGWSICVPVDWDVSETERGAVFGGGAMEVARYEKMDYAGTFASIQLLRSLPDLVVQHEPVLIQEQNRHTLGLLPVRLRRQHVALREGLVLPHCQGPGQPGQELIVKVGGGVPRRRIGGEDEMAGRRRPGHLAGFRQGPGRVASIHQKYRLVIWDVDYLFVDMPPGTGDVALSVFQSLPLDGIIIVASPRGVFPAHPPPPAHGRQRPWGWRGR